MAVASSASVSLQQRTAAVFSSSFVKGTSCGGGLRLSSSPSVSFGVGNVCPRVTAMATKRVIKSSKPGRKLSWLPGVKGGGNFVDPEWLDGSYVSLSLSLSTLDSFAMVVDWKIALHLLITSVHGLQSSRRLWI
jgi:hypothetical protein